MIITNDPWITVSQLHDITIAAPFFHNGRLVALFANCCHALDVCGRGLSADARSVFEEGLKIPIMKLHDAGNRVEPLYQMIAANVRTPDEVIGDIHAQIIANEAGARQLRSFLDEFGLDDIEEVSDIIIERTERAMRAAIGGRGWAAFRDSLAGAVRTTCMIGFILGGAAFLTTVMGYTGIPRALTVWIGELGLSPNMLLAALAVLFVMLGRFLDGISIVVLTTAIVIPMVRESGIDLIWFGIFIVLVVEIAQITPPVGFNLFVVQDMSGRDIGYVTRSVIPFFFSMVLRIAILMVFPGIATWLPATMTAR